MNVIQSAARDIDFHSSLAADSDTRREIFRQAPMRRCIRLGPPAARSEDAKRDAQDIKAAFAAGPGDGFCAAMSAQSTTP